MGSYPTHLARLSTGHIAHVALDLTYRPGTAAVVTGKAYVSVIDPHGRRTCPDAFIPAPEDPFPKVAFRGDTLHVFTQIVGDDGARSMITGICSTRAVAPGCRAE